MHPYGTDSNERRHVLIALVPISFWISDWVARCFAWIGWVPPDEIDWLFDPASAAAWFGLLFLLFERRIWQWRWLHSVGLVESPDLSGVGNGSSGSARQEIRNDRTH